MTTKRFKLNKQAEFLWPDISTDLIRIGPNEDGGYVMPKAAYKKIQHVISFGVNVDWRFERQLNMELNVRVELFEAKSVLRLTLRYWIGGLLKLLLGKFTLTHLADRTYRVIDYFRFFSRSNVKLFKRWIDRDSAINIFNTCPHNTLLKCDIEGGEYEIFDLILKNNNKFSIIAMEIHQIGNNLSKLESFLNELKMNFYLIHMHINNTSVINESSIPDVVELTIANKSLITNICTARQVLPIDNIDFASVQDSDDYVVTKP